MQENMQNDVFERILLEKCPNTESFLVRIFLYLDWIQENTEQKKLRIWTLLTQWNVFLEVNKDNYEFQTSKEVAQKRV